MCALQWEEINAYAYAYAYFLLLLLKCRLVLGINLMHKRTDAFVFFSMFTLQRSDFFYQYFALY